MFNNIWEKPENIYFNEDGFMLLLGNSIDILKNMEDETVDLIFADPPYFSNDGSLKDKFLFTMTWLKECKRILKRNGTIWISCSDNNNCLIGMALEKLGYKILNNIVWVKTNSLPNLSTHLFSHTTETILWAKKDSKAKHIFNYELMKEINGGKQMKDVWQFPSLSNSEKKFGKHPSQKPINLIERLILASSNEKDIILDPFNGSGTTGVCAYRLDRQYIGIDIEKEYLDLTINRYKNEVINNEGDYPMQVEADVHFINANLNKKEIEMKSVKQFYSRTQ
jgi:site-specific DNA-methyltransferase (adenine-specific)